MKHDTQIKMPFLHNEPMVDEQMSCGPMGSRSGWIENVSETDSPEVPAVAESLIEWDNSSPRISSTTKVPTNLCRYLTGEWGCEKNDEDYNPDRDIASSACSPSALEKKEADVEKAENKCLRRVKVPRQRLVPIVHQLAKIYPRSSIQMSGFFLYPDGGYMGWHTNSDAPCTRVYITHVEEGDKSFFRYRDDGEYVTTWDKAGWNLRQFEVTHENPLWHCVYSEVPRLSIGFRINRNLLK